MAIDIPQWVLDAIEKIRKGFVRTVLGFMGSPWYIYRFTLLPVMG
jgi:uroporphyrinogen-III decarboxylase